MQFPEKLQPWFRSGKTLMGGIKGLAQKALDHLAHDGNAGQDERNVEKRCESFSASFWTFITVVSFLARVVAINGSKGGRHQCDATGKDGKREIHTIGCPALLSCCMP